MLSELLRQKFTSGNDVPVSSVRVTREEYEAAVKDAGGGEERKSCELCDCTGDIHDQTGEWRGECPYCRPQASAAVPEGFVLVPRTLTEKMVDASGCDCQPGKSASEVAQRQWDEMLAAIQPEVKS